MRTVTFEEVMDLLYSASPDVQKAGVWRIAPDVHIPGWESRPSLRRTSLLMGRAVRYSYQPGECTFGAA